MKQPPKSNLNRYLTIIFFIALVPASLGYMVHEGSSSTVTVLSIDGSPGGIVFIADPHLREGNLGHIEKTIDEINALRPSVVLIGGDFMYRGAEDLPLNQVWSRIDAPVYAILGNHDYMAGLGTASILSKMALVREVDLRPGTYDVSPLQNEPIETGFAESVVEELEKAGVRVLRNEVVTLDIGGRKTVIVGLDDCWAGRAKPPAVTDTDAFTIYMVHEPDCATGWDADIILAGHTHGGQVMPGNIQTLDAMGILELSGMKTRDGVPLYITRGIGTSNFNPQLRFNAAPEIVLIGPA